MSKGPFDSLNIYLYGIRKSGLKNTIGNSPLLRCENFYLCHNIWCRNILSQYFVIEYLKLRMKIFSVGLSFIVK